MACGGVDLRACLGVIRRDTLSFLATMRILIDITHPAHLHFFRNAISRLAARGHTLLLTARDKDILRDLADELGIEMDFFGGSPAGIVGMARTLIYRKRRLAKHLDRFDPDVLVALGGTFIGFLGWAKRVPSIVFYDTENAKLSNRITYPFATRICTPRSYLHDVKRQVRYAGYHELAYLAPDVFTPDPSVRDALKIGRSEPYAIVRFVGWQASHDLGHSGIGTARKIRLVERLRSVGRVFISAEGRLPEALQRMQFPLAMSRMHDAIAEAAVVVGESSTMASEAAVLGVPSVFIHPKIERGYTREQADRWRIVHWYAADQYEEAIARAEVLMAQARSDHWRSIGRAIVEDSIDVTGFVCDQIEEVGRAKRKGVG